MIAENRRVPQALLERENQKTKVEYTTLPPELPPFIVSVPTGRLHLMGGFIQEVTDTFQLEQPAENMMIMITDNGSTPVDEIEAKIQLPPDLNTDEFPVYMMTGESKRAAFEAIVSRFPDHLQNNPQAMRVAEHLLTKGGYGTQRLRLEAYLSTLGDSPRTEEVSGHVERTVLSLDDDLGMNRGVPMLKNYFATEHNLPMDTNWAAYVTHEQLHNGVIHWDTSNPVFSPYTDVMGKTLMDVQHKGIRAYYEGRNDQNDALERTNGGQIHTAFREHHAEDTHEITDPNARFILGFGRKWGNPDVEAYSKLLSDVEAGREVAELPMQSVLTGKAETIGVHTHPVNMDTAHMARDWSQEVTNMLPYLITDPAISDKYGTMSHFVDGKSKTNGVRAEMCLLIGDNGLLKQISDSFEQTYLAAQVSSTFEHKRLGGVHGLRSPEAVAAFSEFLGMELASVVRDNVVINNSDLTITLNELADDAVLISRETVTNMYDKMMVVTREIDNTVARMRTEVGQNPLAEQAINGLLATQIDIHRRLQVQNGFDAFYMAVNEEMKEQYRFQSTVMEVHSHILRAGAALRREGQYPIAQIHNNRSTTNYSFT